MLKFSERILFMAQNIYIRITILVIIIMVAFTAFFADGYYQWVNSDTAAEAYATTQDIRFPLGLFSEKPFRSRVTGHMLSYVPFNTFGKIYSFISHDPVNSLYLSQGLMTGIIYTFFILVSASYISFNSKITSTRYIASALAVLLFTLIIPPIDKFDVLFGINFRFNHQAVMTNYVGTLVIALIAIFPYWRRFCTGSWDDFYNNLFFRSLFYIMLIAAIFSSTATTIWLTISSTVALFAYMYYFTRTSNNGLFFEIKNIIKNSSVCHSYIFIILLGLIAIYLESFSDRASTSVNSFNIAKYLHSFYSFFSESQSTYIFISLIITILLLYKIYKNKIISIEIKKLFCILPWIIIASIIFIFIIGIPSMPFRYNGYNLGRDTTFVATWTICMWFFGIIFSFWKEKLFVYVVPMLLPIIIINLVYFFPFTNYELRDEQKINFEKIYELNKVLPIYSPIYIWSQNISFSKEECEEYTLPMLRNSGIISPSRTVIVTQ